MPRRAVPYLVDTDPAVPARPGGPAVVALRAHTDDDVDRLLEQCHDPMSIAWTAVPTPYSRDDARWFLREAMPGGWETDQEWGFALDVDGRFGGTVSLRDEGGGRFEIAYGAHPDVRGTGAMERGLRLLLEWGFAERGVRNVVWRANRGNWGSRRLAWRLGFEVTPTPVRAYLDHRGDLVDAWFGTLLPDDERRPANPWFDTPRIESPRLPVRLRAFRDDDVARHVEAARDPDTSFWLSGIPTDYTEDTCRAGLLSDLESAAAGRGMPVAVAATDDDRLIGRISLFDVGGAGGLRADGEIGYWVHPAERGRGVAAEAVRLLTRHALLPVDDGGLGLVRLRAHAAVDNTASRRSLEAASFVEVGVEHAGTRTRAGSADAVLYESVKPD